ncbi:hypothetical protein HPB51_018029 [Rhipicephalus microplus]|uniref:Uncharacterized protein n=1 Tax=Rhipicephalus microplus TaxID=6941 RepID=A0A9J6DPM0_RHIMP|nr:hypothetical protein HPB51_018029 [Rhipicephalus microplus]
MHVWQLERVASGDARCLFLEEQLRCLGQPKHRWREETLQCCLLWNTVSPRGYRLIYQSGLLSLPSCSTLKRHVDAVGNSSALNREPPSPTGETLPNMGDIDDIHELPDVVDVHLVENRTEEGSSERADSVNCSVASSQAKEIEFSRYFTFAPQKIWKQLHALLLLFFSSHVRHMDTMVTGVSKETPVTSSVANATELK